MRVLCLDRIGIWNDGFCRGSKTGELGEKHSEQGKNQQQSPNESGERRVLSPLLFVCLYIFINNNM